MSSPCVTCLDVETAVCHPGTSVVLRESLGMWPICLIVPRLRYDIDCQELRGRSIIVIGSSLGNDIVELPHHIGNEVVVVALMNSTSELRYGYATQPYKCGHAQTWECDVDFTPPTVALHFVNSLILDWGATGGVSLIGASAGAPKIWSFMLVCDNEFIRKWIRYIVSIAGAWHPQLMRRLLGKLAISNAVVLTHHHDRDKLCPWTETLCAFWMDVKHHVGSRFFLQLLQGKDTTFVGRAYHSVYHLLCSMKAFWEMLLVKPETLTPNPSDWCVANNIGLAHACDPTSLVPDSCYTVCPHHMCHNIAASFVLSSAAATASEVLRFRSSENEETDRCLKYAASLVDGLSLPLG